MLMEEEYRRRLHQITSEVKKRLDYHVSTLCVRERELVSGLCLYPQVEVEQTQRSFEQRYMVDWLERQVTEAMKGKQVLDTLVIYVACQCGHCGLVHVQDESLAQCMSELKKFSTA